MCKFCEQYDFTRIGIDMDSWGGKYKPYIFFAGGSGQTSIDQRFRYCPMCGKQIMYKEDGEG